MISKLNLSHAFGDAPRKCTYQVHIGVGGTGREGSRTVSRAEEIVHGVPVPYSLLAEMDLCDETGRGLEPPFIPVLPGAFCCLVLPGVNLAAVVEEHGGNPDHPLWVAVDPDAIRDINDTALLGGYANAQAGRAVQEFLREPVDEFVRDVARSAEAMRRTSVQGWEPVGALQVNVYASPCGAVGSTALHVIDKLRPLLKPPFRIIFNSLLLADHGRVTNRQVARALQHAGMTEILQRTRRM